MRQLRNLNVTESIEQNHLVYDQKWYEKIDLILMFFQFGFFIFISILILNTPFNDKNDKDFVIYFNLPLTIFLGYVAYRKAREKRLIKIDTNFDNVKNKDIVLKFAENKGYDIYRNSGNLLILNNPSGTLQLNETYKITTIIIFQDNKILFAMLKDSFRINLPVLTSHLLFKNDLKKQIKKSS